MNKKEDIYNVIGKNIKKYRIKKRMDTAQIS